MHSQGLIGASTQTDETPLWDTFFARAATDWHCGSLHAAEAPLAL